MNHGQVDRARGAGLFNRRFRVRSDRRDHLKRRRPWSAAAMCPLVKLVPTGMLQRPACVMHPPIPSRLVSRRCIG